MDELNLRVLSVMNELKLSKSAFAASLDISLPMLTHIGSGRNKPGIELIQKILLNFPQISPDWLILGNGAMYREASKKMDLSAELQELINISLKMPDFIKNAQQILDYHDLLLKEISYLKDLSPYLNAIKSNSAFLSQELNQVKEQIITKLKD
jgi:hypothetical protein